MYNIQQWRSDFMLSSLKKYNINDINIERFILKGELPPTYGYYEKEIKLKNETIKKIFIIDIRTINNKIIDYIFDNLEEIQCNILIDDFFKYDELIQKKLFAYSYNMELIFLYDNNRKYNIDKQKVLQNMGYALKHFMTEKQLNEHLNKDYSNLNIKKETLVNLKGDLLKLKRFNYINGANGSGKTTLLNDISKSINVPLFSMNNEKISIENSNLNQEDIKKYFQALTNLTEFNLYSDYLKYMYNLSQILAFSKEKNNMILLDDLKWNALDSRNQLNLIDVLFDYSTQNTSVVITGYNKSSLIKKRVYNPNIIEL